MSFDTFKTSARAFGHYVEQPGLLYKVEKHAYALGAAGLTGIGIADVYRAKPEEKKKVLVRDVSVLAATAAMTLLGAIGLKWMRPVEMKSFEEDVLKPFREHIPELKKQYPDIAHLLDKLHQNAEKTWELRDKWGGSKGRDMLSLSEFKQFVGAFQKKGKEGIEDLNKILDPEESGIDIKEAGSAFAKFRLDVMDDLKKAGAFFATGLLACIGGLGGGIAANKINKDSSPEKTANMIKEGIFQFIANIALCAIGAGMAMAALNIPHIKDALKRMGGAGKGLRIAGIGTGLSLGIFGGGVIANKLGQNFINPMLDKMQGKAPQPVNKNEGKRKIELWDAILHLDDLPTALALAGVAIVEPFIPLFFAFSGYRTGIGYRNDGHSHGHGHHHHGIEQERASQAHAVGLHPEVNPVRGNDIEPIFIIPQPRQATVTSLAQPS